MILSTANMISLKNVITRIWAARWPFIVGLVITAGLALRIWKAWTMQYAANSDFGIVALMAKHMAEGADYPAFFYGQPYMGSLEPAIAALLAVICRLEVSGFIVTLAPALVGIFLLPVLYVFGRNAGSRRAGLAAMLYCLVGSDTLFHYSVAPRGGYMNMMVGGLIALWLACRIAAGERRNEPPPWSQYLWMGLAAGIAWWSTQLAIVYLLAAMAVLLLGFRWGMLKKGFLPALLGFVAGSLPWWLWNATHGWDTMSFGESLGKVSFLEGVCSFCNLFMKVVEMPAHTSWIHTSRLIVLSAMLVFFVVIMVRDRIRKESSETFFYRSAMLLVIIFMILSYSTSHYVHANAERYLLPVIPALAIMLGVSTDRLLQYSRFPLGWLVFVFILPTHILCLSQTYRGMLLDRSQWELATQLSEQIAPSCDGIFVGNYSTHWINFASHEKLCVAAIPRERYAPYAVKAELAERRAYLDNYMDLASFMRRTASKGQRTSIGNMVVDYDIRPPGNDWDYVKTNCIAEAVDHEGKHCRDILLDYDLGSSWKSVIEPKTSAAVTMTFSRQVPVCGVRFISSKSRYPGEVSIEGKTDSAAEWQTLLAPVRNTDYFWSGTYLMLGEAQYYQEFRFPPPAGGLREIRFTFHGHINRPEFISIDEVLFLEQTQESMPPSPSVAECVSALHDCVVSRFYAPKWLAERISVATSNSIPTIVPSLLTRTIHELPRLDPIQPEPVSFKGNTGMLLDCRDAPRTRALLQAAGMRFEEKQLGSYVLLIVPGNHAGADTREAPSLCWTEHGCFRVNFHKAKAHALFKAVVGGQTSGHPSTVEALQEILQLYPGHQPARKALTTALKECGRIEEANVNEKALKEATQPAHAAPIRFRNGIDFVGVSLNTNSVIPGQTLEVLYFWKCPTTVDTEKLAVFVHFVSGKNRFQDDHVFLRNIPQEDIAYQPFAEIFRESRKVTIPASIPAGEYRVAIGLLDRIGNNRMGFQTELRHRKRAVELSVVVKVGDPLRNTQ